MAEKTVELMSGSPLEMKLEEVLGKVTENQCSNI